MTKADLQYTLNDLGIISDQITPALPMKYIVLQKYETKFTSVNDFRFKFDMTNEYLLVYHVSKSPLTEAELVSKGYTKNVNFDIVNGVPYIYLCDSNKEPLVDSYDFSIIYCVAAA